MSKMKLMMVMLGAVLLSMSGLIACGGDETTATGSTGAGASSAGGVGATGGATPGSGGNGGDRSDICRHSPNNAASFDHIDLADYC